MLPYMATGTLQIDILKDLDVERLFWNRGWVQCNHKGPFKKEQDVRIGERDMITEAEVRECLVAFKMKRALELTNADASGNWKR